MPPHLWLRQGEIKERDLPAPRFSLEAPQRLAFFDRFYISYIDCLLALKTLDIQNLAELGFETAAEP